MRSCCCRELKRCICAWSATRRTRLPWRSILQSIPGVEWVNYPGLESSPYHARAKKYLPNGQSSLLTFGIKGGFDAGKKLINSLKLFLAAGQHRRCQVARHSSCLDHAPAAFRGGAGCDRCYSELVRLSVGIEDVRDLIADLNQAIEAANGQS